MSFDFHSSQNPLLTFTRKDAAALASMQDFFTMRQQVIDRAWDTALRKFFDANECGLPTPVTLRNHGQFVLPHPDQAKTGHKLFRWRGQIVLEGFFEEASVYSSQYYTIRSVQPGDPLPWEKSTDAAQRVPTTIQA